MEIQKSSRLYSLDALRGFDIFWIIGGEEIIHGLNKYTGWSWTAWLSFQLNHVEWNGFHFYDLIFPLFLFMSGMTMPYSFGRLLEKGITKKEIYSKVLKRSVLLVLLGIVYNGLWDLNYTNIRFASVLGHIGIAYFFAAIIYLNTDLKKQILWIIGILIGYWAILSFIPVPGIGAGVLTKEGCLNGFIDRIFMPGRLYEGIFDPEGLLAKIPAISTALLGALTGTFIKNAKINNIRKVLYLILSSWGLYILSSLWDLALPINKKLWTSSFVLHTAAWSILLFAVFYLIIDVLGYKKWAFPLTVIGMNSITIYLGNSLFNFAHTANYLFGGLIAFFPEGLKPALMPVAVVIIEWILLYFLYRKNIFLKI